MLNRTLGRNAMTYRVLETFYRYRLLFWVATIGITALVSSAVYLRSRSFAASASTQIVPEQEVASALGLQRQNWASPSEQNVSRFNDLLRDDEPGGFLDTALQNARLSHPIRVGPGIHDERFGELRRKLTVGIDSADVFTLSLVWDDRGECERILHALQAGYIEEAGASRQAQSIATANFLDTQIKAYQGRMRVAEQALIDYKRKHFGQLPEAQSAEIEQLADLKAERDYQKITSHDATLQRQALEARLHVIKPTAVMEETVRNTPKKESSTAAGLRTIELRRVAMLGQGWRPGSTPIQQLNVQIKDLRLRVAQEKKAEQAAAAALPKGTNPNMVQTTTQTNPEYMSLTEQLTQAKIQQSTTTARLALLNQQIAAYEKRVRQLPLATRALTDKTRDYSIMKEQYEDLLKRREQAQIKANLDKVAATSTLHPIGVVFAQPTYGAKKTMVLLIGTVFFSMMVGAGLVIGAELLDQSLRYETDIERLLGARLVTALPYVAPNKALPSLPGSRYLPSVAAAPMTGINP